jgi:hypothetical protein
MPIGRFRAGPPSIYEYIRAHLAEVGLAEGAETLPDEDELAQDSPLRWAPGALEGMLTRAGDSETDEELIAELHAALVELADRPGGRSRARARRVFRRAEPRAHVDAVLTRLHAFPPRDLDRLYREVRSIVLESGRRDEVKFALAVLGGFAKPDDAEVLRTFARHEEFTRYAAVALAAVVEDAVPEWLELIRHVDGWGRIELVELLLGEPRSDVCAFLLREGFRNSIMYGYTAQMVADHCDLAGALEGDTDEALVAGARDILSTLADEAWGGPAGGMLDYPNGLTATERLLELVESRDLADFLAVDSIRAFAEDDLDWAGPDERRELEERCASLGWTAETRARLASRCREILGRPSWRDLVAAELGREHDELPWQAVQVARRLDVPVREFLVAHIERYPEDSGAWFHLLHEADAEALDLALALARRLFDFGELAQGPGGELHRPGVFDVADWLLQELVEHPGRGWDVIRPALRSPVVRNRLFALRALSRWPDGLTEEMRRAVDAVRDDPDEDVRRDAGRVLRGEPIEPPMIELDGEEE